MNNFHSIADKTDFSNTLNNKNEHPLTSFHTVIHVIAG